MSQHDDQRRYRGEQQRGNQQGYRDDPYQQGRHGSPGQQSAYQGGYRGQQGGNYGGDDYSRAPGGRDAYADSRGYGESRHRGPQDRDQGPSGYPRDDYPGDAYRGASYDDQDYRGGSHASYPRGRQAERGGGEYGSYRGMGGNSEGYGGGWDRGGAADRGGWSDPSYRAQGPQSGGRHHDPDYDQWRNQQISELDRDYDTWRQERYKKFSDDFSTWRNSRTSTADRASTDETDVDSGLPASASSRTASSAPGTSSGGKDAKHTK